MAFQKIQILILALALPGLAGAQCLPQPDHVVIVIEENHSGHEVLGPHNGCPYLTSLAAAGANMQNSYAIEHPSQPNYLDIFTGSHQNINDDSCVAPFSADNLASQLIAHRYTFTGYAEGLPSPGSRVCSSGSYARKHVPWAFLTNVPAACNQPFTAFQALKGNYSQLPTVSFVIPDLVDDMHDGSPAEADQWLQANINAYYHWAMENNSLLIITWDEDDSTTSNNSIPTIFLGPMVIVGPNTTIMNHYDLLRTLEDMYHLIHTGHTRTAHDLIPVFNCDHSIQIK